MPSCVATLAGLLTLPGMHLYILGPTGSINLPFTSPLVRFGQIMIMPVWLSFALALLPGLVMIYSGVKTMKQRSDADLSATGMTVVLIKAAILTVALLFAVYYLEQGRGVSWMFGVFVLFVVVLDYGLTLLNLSFSLRYVITGAVLAIAVIVDCLARRSRASHGRA